MDWIKVLNRHVLFEYDDLRDSEFVAWIKIMALTAYLEHIPTHEQMLKHVHYKTLMSLQDKLNKHSIDLQYVLNKVLIDAQYVHNRRETWKKNKQQYRDDKKNVSMDVSMDVSSIEKRREDKYKDKEKNINRGKIKRAAFIIPSLEEVTEYCNERKNQIKPSVFLDHYTGNGWMVGKNKMKDWKAVIRTWETRDGGNGNGSKNVNTYPNRAGNPRAVSDETERELAEIGAGYAAAKAAKEAARRQANGNAEGNDVPDFGMQN
jgi:hypothetical protein